MGQRVTPLGHREQQAVTEDSGPGQRGPGQAKQGQRWQGGQGPAEVLEVGAESRSWLTQPRRDPT